MSELKFMVNEFERALLTLDRLKVEELISAAVKMNAPVHVASELVTEVLYKIGDDWEKGRLALSQVYMSGIICEEVIDKILPRLSPLRKNQPKMAIAVFEDYHLLGKRIIYSSLRASGFELTDLGGGLTTESLVKIVKEKEIKILLLSVLMLPSALRIKNFKEELGDPDVKIIVGGAPFRFDNELWMEIGAYAMGKDPHEAIEIVTKLMGGI
ncbi:MAG: cobalamin-dependent protein [Ignavibacteria bacterium]